MWLDGYFPFPASPPDYRLVLQARCMVVPATPTAYSDFLSRHSSDPGSTAGQAPGFSTVQLAAPDYSTVWVALTHRATLGPGTWVVTEGGSPRTVQSVRLLTPWVVRVTLQTSCSDVGEPTYGAAIVVQLPAGALVAEDGTPSLALTSTPDGQNRYPLMQLLDIPWATPGTGNAAVWAVLLKGWGRMRLPTRARTVLDFREVITAQVPGFCQGENPALVPSGSLTCSVGYAGDRILAVPATVDGTDPDGIPVRGACAVTGASGTNGSAATLVVRSSETCQTQGGGGTAVPKAYGKVYGGNFARTGGTVAIPTYPRSKPFIFSLTRTATGAPQDPASPLDWTKLDLPGNFAHGDPIPQRLAPWVPAVASTALSYPPGVGYVRLLRGSPAVGASRWDGDVEYLPDLTLVAPKLYCLRVTTATPTEAILYWDRPVKDPVRAKIVVSGAGVPDYTAPIGDRVIRLTWAVALTAPQQSVLTVTCAAGACASLLAGVASVPGTATALVDGTLPGRTATLLAAQINPTWGLAGVLLVKLRLYYDMPLEGIGYTTGITLTGTAATPNKATGTDSGYLELDLTTGITDPESQGVVRITVPAGAARAKPDAPGIPSGTSTGGTFTVQVIRARACYVLVSNRYTGRDYTSGDLVEIPGDTLVLPDTQTAPVTRTLYDTTALDTGIQGPHRHLTEGGGPLGGGAAYATPMPAGAGTFLETSWMNFRA